MNKNIFFKFIISLFFSVCFFNINISVNALEWGNSLTEMITARRNTSSVAYSNKIYVFGGLEGRIVSKKVEVYNIETDTWESLPDMPVERYSHQSVLYKDKIYVIGGYNRTDGFLDRVDIYDLKTREWSQGSNMPTPRSSFVAEVVDGKIYCIAGEIGTGYSDALEIYNIESNSWIENEGLSVARGDTDGVYKDGKIYIIGGYNGVNALDIVDVYDVQKGTWDTLSSLNVARYLPSIAVYGNEIYALGGYDISHLAINSIEKYNIVTDTWEQISSMIDVKGGATAQSYYGKIYLIGGYNNIDDVSSVLSYTVKSVDVNQKAIDSVEKAEGSWSNGDISVGRRMVEKVNEEQLKNSLSIRLDFLEGIFERKTVSSNIDVYIKSENMLSLSLDTNLVTFNDFSGVEDVEKLKVINLSINSSLPYQINAYLVNEIQNGDKSQTMNTDILNIKESSEIDYQSFVNSLDKIILKDNNPLGNNLIHGIDIKLKGNIAHKKDIYKTVIKFEVVQK